MERASIDDVKLILEWAQEESTPSARAREVLRAAWHIHRGRGVGRWDESGGYGFGITYAAVRRLGLKGLEPLRKPAALLLLPIVKGWGLAPVTIESSTQPPHMWAGFASNGDGKYEVVLSFAWPGSFLVGLAQLLAVHGESLRSCASCQRVFVRTKRQAYCTPACSQRERSKRWYKTNRPLALETRHEQHVKRQYRQTGAALLRIPRKQRGLKAANPPD